MAQRMHNLSKWRFVKEGEGVIFRNTRRRLVTLEVNCPDRVAFYISQDLEQLERNPEVLEDLQLGRSRDGLPLEEVDGGRGVVFIGTALGRDRFEFNVDGAFELVVHGGNAYVYSADSQDVAAHIVAPIVFTRIANRRQRNPHLEMIEYQMRLNQARFQQELRDEADRRLGDLERRYAAQRGSGAVVEGSGGVGAGAADVRPETAHGGAGAAGAGPAAAGDDPPAAGRKKASKEPEAT